MEPVESNQLVSLLFFQVFGFLKWLSSKLSSQAVMIYLMLIS